MQLLIKFDDACHWKRYVAWFLITCSWSHVERSIRSYWLVVSQRLRGRKAVMSTVSFTISYHLTEIWEPWPWKVLSSQDSSFRSWIFCVFAAHCKFVVPFLFLFFLLWNQVPVNGWFVVPSRWRATCIFLF